MFFSDFGDVTLDAWCKGQRACDERTARRVYCENLPESCDQFGNPPKNFNLATLLAVLMQKGIKAPGPYTNVKCWSQSGGKTRTAVGNADRCDDFDFTDYDIYGMARGWWRATLPVMAGCDKDGKNCTKVVEPARGEYCGDARGAPMTGDVFIGKNKKGEATYSGKKIGMEVYTLGPSFCRRSNKDWRQEEIYELGFLIALRALCQANKLEDAINLQNAFAFYKSGFRDQWVTFVPDFLQTSDSNYNNGRYTYALARVWNVDPDKLASAAYGRFVYLTTKHPVSKYKTGGSWRRGLVGKWGRPGGHVMPPDDEECKAVKAIEAIQTTIQTMYDWVGGNWLLSYVNPENYIGPIATALGEASNAAEGTDTAAGGNIGARVADINGWSGKFGAMGQSWVAFESACGPVAEYKLQYQITQIGLWKDAASKALLKVDAAMYKQAAGVKPGSKPPAKRPPVKLGAPATPGTSSLTTVLLGAGAGLAAGGPVGAAVGAVLGALLGKKP